jgi:hypothetical protein
VVVCPTQSGDVPLIDAGVGLTEIVLYALQPEPNE